MAATSVEKRRRLTVGILPDSHVYNGMYPSWFYAPIIRGAQMAAREQGINLLVACGVLHGPKEIRYRIAWPVPHENADFLPVGSWNTDGLVVFSPLRSEERIRYIAELQERRFPVLFIGSGTGSPTIMVDNEGGIRQSLEHLVSHGHRAVAFIAGDPQDPGDSLSRVEAYRRGVRELKLSDDPRLLEYGLHWDEEAYRAMNRMLQSGAKFTAVMCSNDFSSLGVVRALNEAGLRIPWDVAVTGFDDQPEALTQIPPLTSVHYPLFETGYRSILLIRKRIEEGPDSLPPEVRVSTRLITRQSCGCLPDVVGAADLQRLERIREFATDSARVQAELTQAVTKALETDVMPGGFEETSLLCGQLVGSFLLSLRDGDAARFRTTLIQILQQIERFDGNAHSWQAAVSILRLGLQAMPAGGPGSLDGKRAEDLLHQARTLLSESAWRRYERQQLSQTHREEALGRLSARLLSSLEEDQIHDTLREDLPPAGVRGCRVAFFEPREGDPFAGSVVRRGGDGSDCRFESRNFPPPGLYSGEEPLNLALLPLFFQEENLGYVAFDAEDLKPLSMIAMQLASSIKSAQLHSKVLELSLTDSLTEVFNRRYFEIILQKETERSRRYDRGLAVVMIDIDRFKEYNDLLGHPAGDEALRAVARAIGCGARRGLDVATRFGGDEFAVILPETDYDGARIVADNIHGQVRAETRFARPLTISLGIASLHGDRLQARELVGQADRALYQAKHQGGNRAVAYEDWMVETAHPAELDLRDGGSSLSKRPRPE